MIFFTIKEKKYGDSSKNNAERSRHKKGYTTSQLHNFTTYNRRFNRIFIVLIVGLFIMISHSYAEIPAPNESFSIDSVRFECDSLIFVGDTIVMEIKFTPFVKDSVMIAFTRQPGLRIVGEDTTNEGIYEFMGIDSIFQVTKTYQIVVDSIIPNSLLFYTKTFRVFPDFTDLASYTQVLKVANNQQSLQLSGGNIFCGTVNNNNDDECQSYYYYGIDCTPSNPSESTVNIVGNVKFRDLNEPYYNQYYIEHKRKKSPFTEVWLFFREVGQENYLTHPISLNDGQPIEGIHYAKCNQNGFYQFSFNYNKSVLECSPEVQFEPVIFVAKENEALWLESTTEHRKINNIGNPYRSPSPSHIRLFNLDGTGRFYKDENGNYWGYRDFLLDEFDGSTFRHITLSREYLKQIYGTSFNDLEAPQVRVRTNWNGNTSNFSRINNTITMLNKFHTNSVELLHEYSHFFDYHNINLYGMNNFNLSEGFAMFFSWAYRTWLNRNYYDQIDQLKENTEIAPFTSFQNYYRPIGSQDPWTIAEDENANRFANLSKVLVNSFWEDKKSCSFASFLWNIYDGRNMGQFKFIPEQDKENDDIDGLHLTLFNSLLDIQTSDSILFLTTLKSRIDNPDLNESIDNLFAFMDFSGNKDNFVEDIATWMKSPNLDFSYTFDGLYFYVTLGSSNSYNTNQIIREYISIDNNNPTQERKQVMITEPYGNPELTVSWRSYNFLENKWNNPNYLLNYPNVNSLMLPVYSLSKYKISTFNSRGGDSYLPLTLTFPFKHYLNEGSTEIILSSIEFENSTLSFTVSEQVKYAITIYDLTGKVIYNDPSFKESSIGVNRINLTTSLGMYNIKFVRFSYISKDGVFESQILKILN